MLKKHSELFSRVHRRQVAIVLMGALCVVFGIASTASAQGGMRGGGGGGRGGMGGRGGGGAGRGEMKSPAETAKKNLQQNDPIKFLLDQKKALALTNMQRDTLKSLQKEMQHMQEPLFKDIEKLSADMSGRGGARGGMGRGGGRGGPTGGTTGGEGEPPEGGRGRGGVPDTVRALVARLSDIQDAYRDRAHTKLTDIQRSKADSLFEDMLAKDRKKAEQEREKRGF